MAIVDIKIHKILNDKSHAYHSKRDDAAHRAAVEEMSRLYAEKERETRHSSGRNTSASVDASDILIIPSE